MSAQSNLEALRRYFRAIADGASPEELASYFDPAVVQEEFPNRIVPNGARRDLPAILEGARRGRALMSAQSFEIVSECACGDSVAVEVIWTGTLAVAMGPIPAGGTMRARSAMFLRFRDRRIVQQRNYDCFDPF